MTWEDILKAPFDVQASTEQQQSPEELIQWADQTLDIPLQEAISENPQGEQGKFHRVNLGATATREFRNLTTKIPNWNDILVQEYNVSRIKGQYYNSGDAVLFFYK